MSVSIQIVSLIYSQLDIPMSVSKSILYIQMSESIASPTHSLLDTLISATSQLRPPTRSPPASSQEPRINPKISPRRGIG